MSCDVAAEEVEKKKRWGDFPLHAFLTCLLCLGLLCRFYNLHWDECRLLHPDERFLTSVVMRVKLPESWDGYFQSRTSEFNPANVKDVHYVYGQFPVLLGRLLASELKITDDGQFLPYGRALSAFFDCITVLVTCGMAIRLLGKTGGLLAGVFVSLAALHIQQSHFFVTDTFAAAFLAFALQGTIRWVERGRVREGLETGLALGLALACKFSALLFVMPAAVAFLIVWRRFGVRHSLAGGLLFAVSTFVLFRLGHPMAFLGEGGIWAPFDVRPDPRFWSDLHNQAWITRGEADVPFNVQWIGRTPWLYGLSNLAGWGWGWAFMLSSGLGLFLMWLGLLTKKRPPAGVFLACFYALAVLAIQGGTFSKFSRYYLPITGSAAIVAAYGWTELAGRNPRWKWGPAIAALGCAGWGLAVTSIYDARHTRLLATDWIRTNLPAGTIVATETAWDEGLPLGWVPWPEGVTPHPDVVAVDLAAFEPETERKRQNLLAALDASQWVFISSPRAWATIPRWPEKYPVMNRYYQTLFDGNLGFELKKEFAVYPHLGPWTFPDGGAEEALTVYDHPRVLLFQKGPNWSFEKAKELLEAVSLPENKHNWQPRLAPAPDEAGLPRPPG